MKTTNESRVELLDCMGSDLTVVNAARVSFDKRHEEFQEKDEKLIGYLARHGHWTPFAHAQLQFRVTAPIFVARQLVKHQVGLVWNEVSRRYVDDAPEYYMLKWRGAAENVKQGSGGEVDRETEVKADEIFWTAVETSHAAYLELLKLGIAPEQARSVLNLNHMTSWYWTGSLMAFARVCKQRLDPHAQQETREVAQQINELIKPLFPVSWAALNG